MPPKRRRGRGAPRLPFALFFSSNPPAADVICVDKITPNEINEPVVAGQYYDAKLPDEEKDITGKVLDIGMLWIYNVTH